MEERKPPPRLLVEKFQLHRLEGLAHGYTKIICHGSILLGGNRLTTKENIPVAHLVDAGFLVEGTAWGKILDVLEARLQKVLQTVFLHQLIFLTQTVTKGL